MSIDKKKLMDFVMDVTLGYDPNMVRLRLNDAIAKHFPDQPMWGKSQVFDSNYKAAQQAENKRITDIVGTMPVPDQPVELSEKLYNMMQAHLDGIYRFSTREDCDALVTELIVFCLRAFKRESAQPDESPYKAFFDALWTAYCNNEIHFDDADFIITVACKNGLAKEEEYDPSTHGEALGDEWGLEEGDSCYILVKQLKRESVGCPSCGANTVFGYCPKSKSGKHYDEIEDKSNG